MTKFALATFLFCLFLLPVMGQETGKPVSGQPAGNNIPFATGTAPAITTILDASVDPSKFNPEPLMQFTQKYLPQIAPQYQTTVTFKYNPNATNGNTPCNENGSSVVTFFDYLPTNVVDSAGMIPLIYETSGALFSPCNTYVADGSGLPLETIDGTNMGIATQKAFFAGDLKHYASSSEIFDAARNAKQRIGGGAKSFFGNPGPIFNFLAGGGQMVAYNGPTGTMMPFQLASSEFVTNNDIFSSWDSVTSTIMGVNHNQFFRQIPTSYTNGPDGTFLFMLASGPLVINDVGIGVSTINPLGTAFLILQKKSGVNTFTTGTITYWVTCADGKIYLPPTVISATSPELSLNLLNANLFPQKAFCTEHATLNNDPTSEILQNIVYYPTGEVTPDTTFIYNNGADFQSPNTLPISELTDVETGAAIPYETITGGIVFHGSHHHFFVSDGTHWRTSPMPPVPYFMSFLNLPDPVIAAVANAASFDNTVDPNNWTVAPGGLASVYGQNLTPHPPSNNAAIPLPVYGCTGSSEINEGSCQAVIQDSSGQKLQAGFFYSSDIQLNIRIPSSAQVGPARLWITREGQLGDPYQFTIAAVSPGIYVSNGFAIAQFYTPRKALYQTVDNGANKATTGDTLVIYCNGLGTTTNDPADSTQPAPDVASPAVVPLTATFTDSVGNSITVNPYYAGLTPGAIGLYQVDVTIPTGLQTSGGSINVVFTQNGQNSSPAVIPTF